MKRIFLALIVLISAGALAFATTRAAWTDTVTVTNNQIQTGTADLQVSTDFGSTWNTGTKASSMVLTNLIPGNDTNAYSFSLWNASTTELNFTVSGQITTVTGTDGVDESQLEIAVYEIDSIPETGSGWISLANWQIIDRVLDSIINSGISNAKDYRIAARLLSSATNDWQGKTVTFTLTLTGTQQIP